MKMDDSRKRIKMVGWLLLLPVTFGFYLPGVAPKDYVKGENVQVLVNALSSSATVLHLHSTHYSGIFLYLLFRYINRAHSSGILIELIPQVH
jgi:hypothetical protein